MFACLHCYSIEYPPYSISRNGSLCVVVFACLDSYTIECLHCSISRRGLLRKRVCVSADHYSIEPPYLLSLPKWFAADVCLCACLDSYSIECYPYPFLPDHPSSYFLFRSVSHDRCTENVYPPPSLHDPPTWLIIMCEASTSPTSLT